ncbi:MAG: DUF11 domain-containing protein [Candidatus Saccharimonadales bacterium]
MKRIMLLLANAGLLLAIGLPLASVGTAQAAEVVFPCVINNQIQVDAVVDVPPKCDLAVDKQVSVNGGAFVEADSSADALAVQVGDTVTWQVTVTDNSVGGPTPQGTVFIKDQLPEGVSFVSYTASDGTYTGNDGSFFANEWTLPLKKNVGDALVTTLPATLTITTKVTGSGLIENTAQINKDDPASHCDGGCAYGDNVGGNNQNDAWINSQVAPQVLAASTTTSPDTGFGTPAGKSYAPLLIGLGIVGLAVSLVSRRRSSSQLN